MQSTYESNYENDNSGSSYSGSSYSGSNSIGSSNECYICGESASKKVGSNWYCYKHAKLVDDHSYDTNDSYNSYNNSNNSNIGEGGYEMPNENDKSFSDYIKRVDPDLYNDINSNYNDAAGY